MAELRHRGRPGHPGPVPVAELAALCRRHRIELPGDLLAAIADAMAAAGAGDPALCGQVYEASLDRGGRRATGVFYTPPHLVDFVVERTVGPSVDTGGRPRVLDPACGGGIFLLAAHARGVAAADLIGVDIDPVAAGVCQLALALAGAEGARVDVADALVDPLPEVDAVVGNPPWGQKKLRFAPDYAATLRDRYRTGTGVLDPFKLFVERGIRQLAPGGRLGMVLPDIVLLKNQRPVRDLMLEQTSIDWLVHAGRAFPGVNLDAAVAVVCKGPPADDHRVSIWHQLPDDWRSAPPPTHTLAQSVFGELADHRFNLYLDDDDIALLRKLAALPRFGDRFEVHEGVHTGNARGKLFVEEKRPGAVPVIVGRRELARYRLSWAGTWLDRSPDAIDKGAGDYANLGRPAWHRAGKIVVRRTGDRIIAARDLTGYHVSNNAFVALPRAPMTDDELAVHVGLLNSRLATWYFRTVQPRVGRLFAELKINHLVDVPLPRALPAIAELVARREAADDPDADAAIDRAVEDAFELTSAERALLG